MHIEFPHFAALEETLLQVALARFGEQVRSVKQLAPAIAALSDYYNAPASERGAGPGGKYHQAARLLFFTVADMPKAYAIAAEVDRLRALPRRETLKVLDVGAGYGAQSVGLLAYLRQAGWQGKLRLDAVDWDAGALETFEQCVQSSVTTTLFRNVALNLRRADLNQKLSLRDRYDIILMGSTLCELQPAIHYSLLETLVSALTESGVLAVIEPALKTTSRALHALRDRLVAEGRAHILAPCTRQAQCPCLENAKDWCHEARSMALPPRARQLATATGLRTHDVKWSFMALAHPSSQAETPPDAWRVVSDLLKSKGKHEIFLCGPAGRLRAILQKRDKSPANAPFQKLQRGHTVRIENAAIKHGMLLIESQSVVARCDVAPDPATPAT